jgi:hypothetical protein
MSLASTPRRASSFVSRVMIDWSSGWNPSSVQAPTSTGSRAPSPPHRYSRI